VANLASGPLAESLLTFDGRTLGLGPRPLRRFEHICAVEIKLRDWKAGLAQAVRYKTFSDEVYVFLGRIPKAPPRHAFTRSGVGLVQLGPEPAVVVAPTDTSNENVTMCRRIVEENINRAMRAARRRPF